ncbi:putative bifunctional diguanylate cyclase/phosphodiesterase [Thauera sp. Sel9]|uniref:putative bifunctional diguanylate cyclase/phosphodiesterase n=1 Tax=Thauera sp. Sel9 TaxID=2974299 RepID=UPI0021E18A65|nr:EAL domain-containing protein [Thauera sp. Sel9]MCV2218486.1 EAL domain-containing protein [Thauera sp. Sel9]
MTLLRALMVEDNEDDSILVQEALRSAGYDVRAQRVETEDDLRHALRSGPWDIVLSDYMLPSFDARGALGVIRNSEIGLPVIVISGTVGEDVAVETLKLGADDYVLKDNLTRLVPAVARALDAAENRRQQNRLEHMKTLILENSLDLICTLDTQGCFLEVSAAAQAMLDYEPAELMGTCIERLIHPDGLLPFQHEFQAVLQGQRMRDFECSFVHKSGWVVFLTWSAVLSRDHGVVVCVGRDVTERKQAEQRIHYLATHDGLTGLPNRNLVQDRIQQVIAHVRRSGRLLALLFLDLDRFKVINDCYGHPFGDAVLKAAARRLASLVREGDTVARQGGDEFLILLTDLRQTEDAHEVAGKIVQALKAPLIVQGREVHLTGSIGAAVFPQDGESADALIGNADVAMYRAKSLGRNTCQFFTREMSKETQHRVSLETRLHDALALGQFQLAYQPKVDLHAGRITGCEALLRWHHPELGMVPPAQFIPIAEDSGLIVPIGDWVLRTACAQAKAWRDAGLPRVTVAVNISARQFLQQDVIDWVMGTLRSTGLPPELLELELTESLIAQDVEKVIAAFGRLRDIGVKISIDDFGTGYSNLGYLKRFPADTLKIDQSFVRDMLTDPEDATIVLAVISLAHNLGFKVIAEGVETEAHRDFLCRNRCDEIQGYYFSRPVSAAEFEDLLRCDKRLP